MSAKKGFSQKEFLHAMKIVKGNYKQYLCFFVALFVIQSFLWFISLSTGINNINIKTSAEEAYDYHIKIENMTSEQMASLQNTILKSPLMEYDNLKPHVKLEIIPVDLLGDIVYDAYVTLNPRLSLERANVSFFNEFVSKSVNKYDNKVNVTYTPLYTYNTVNVQDNNTLHVWLVLLMSSVSVFLLVLLYNIRLNHYKFMYGIYMTFGADFKKLFSTAFFELISVSLIVFLPSLAFSALLVGVMYSQWSLLLIKLLPAFAEVLIMNLIIVLISVFFPMRIMATKPPVNLIITQDNSNQVTSPRRSFHIFGKSFPFAYELFSVWRFRWFYLKLLGGAVAFCAMFLCGIFIGQLYINAQEYPEPEFYVTSDISVDDETIDLFNGITNVKYAIWDVSSSAALLSHHMLLKDDNLYNSSGYSVGNVSGKQEDYRFATNSYSYMYFDEKYVQSVLENGIYEIEGDINSVFNDNKTVVVSESIYNARRFSFKVGDKIVLAKFAYPGKNLGDVTDPLQVLIEQLKYHGFTYEEFTVGAVIKNTESAGGFTVGMKYDDYVFYVDEEPVRRLISIYTEEGLTNEEIVETGKQVRLFASITNAPIKYRFNQFEKMIEKDNSHYELIIIIAVMLIIMSPLVWFFSQLLFMSKREKEWYILQALGANQKQMDKLPLISGGALSVLAIIFAVVLGYISSYIVYVVINQLLPKFGMNDGIGYAFDMPLYALGICVVVSVLCGLLSTVIPYLFYKKKQKNTALYQNSGVDEE